MNEEPQIWYDMCRKTVTSEEEGRALLANPKLVEMMTMTAEASMNRHRQDGYEFTQVHRDQPVLVVNTSDAEVYKGYSHFIQQVTTSLRRKVAP
jgi:hypothetical protein